VRLRTGQQKMAQPIGKPTSGLFGHKIASDGHDVKPDRQPTVARFGHDFCHIAVHTGGATLQPKMAVSTPGDDFEQEADAVADQVIRMPVSTSGLPISRGCDATVHAPNAERGEEMCPKSAAADFQTTHLQAKQATSRAPTVTPTVQTTIDRMRGGGSPLDKATRTFMETRFGYNFANVRVHTDARAADSSCALNASAFTVGQDIAFGPGQYIPNTYAGKRVLAHELVHVVQQGRAAQIRYQYGQQTGHTHTEGTEADLLGDPGNEAFQRDARSGALARVLTSTVQVQRIYEPPSPEELAGRRTQSKAQKRAADRSHDLFLAMKRWSYAYTKETREAVSGLEHAMENREVYEESLDLDPSSDKAVQSVTDYYFPKLMGELVIKPQDDPNQEGNVLGIWRLWDAAFSNKLATEQLANSPVEPGEEPGDYPTPGSPLDTPQGTQGIVVHEA
jgi:hypothetical protein